jgi:hypothetical protein
VLLLLACGAPRPAAADDPDGDARLATALCSPLAAVRREAVARAVRDGAAGRARARRWVRAPDPRLRAGAWEILARVGTEPDLRAAIPALGETQPDVAARAAEALLALAARLPPSDEPWLPAGCLPAQAVPPLSLALVRALEDAPRGGLPAAVTRLGEGIVPCLGQVLLHARYGVLARVVALRALAAMADADARRVLSDVAPQLVAAYERRHDPSLLQAWWSAVNEVGPGPGLEGVQAIVVEVARETLQGSWRRGWRALPWPSQVQFYRFLASCPPAAGRNVLQAFAADTISHQGRGRTGLYPALAAAAVRAWLVLCGPSEEGLHDAVLAARPRGRGRWRRRWEELGEVLVQLEPWRARRGLQEGLDELLEDDELPHGVRAWAHYLKGDRSRKELAREAADLIDAGGGAATQAQRRLGARLLDRLGTPDAERIERTARDTDAWMRALGLVWAVRASQAGDYPSEALEAAVARDLRDPEDGVFLVAAEVRGAALAPAERARLLDLAVRGPRALRNRAWKALVPTLGRGAAELARALPRGHASLDARLRAEAAVLRVRLR